MLFYSRLDDLYNFLRSNRTHTKIAELLDNAHLAVIADAQYAVFAIVITAPRAARESVLLCDVAQDSPLRIIKA